jgi:hypothetical protein
MRTKSVKEALILLKVTEEVEVPDTVVVAIFS